MSTKRPRRGKKTAVADPSLYLGYVEDEETPEMIMRKFEALEKIEKGRAPSKEDEEREEREEGLTAQEQRKLFRETSFYSVGMLQKDDIDAIETEEEDWDFLDDDWEEYGTEEEAIDERTVVPPFAARNYRIRLPPDPTKEGTHASGETSYERVRIPENLEYMPNVFVIRPITAETPASVVSAEPPLALYPGQATQVDEPFKACYISTANLVLSEIRFEELVAPGGFLLLWVEKVDLASTLKVFAECQFTYVENICWLHLTPTNRIVTEEAAFFRKSHATLLVFRRVPIDSNDKVKLRHQRNADVVSDFLLGEGHTPERIYDIVEEMLPQDNSSACVQDLLEISNNPMENSRTRWRNAVVFQKPT